LSCELGQWPALLSEHEQELFLVDRYRLGEGVVAELLGVA
jgi:hypothetical protein